MFTVLAATLPPRSALSACVTPPSALSCATFAASVSFMPAATPVICLVKRSVSMSLSGSPTERTPWLPIMVAATPDAAAPVGT